MAGGPWGAGVGGAGTLAQVLPPSRVRRSDTVQVGHEAPSTHPVCRETNVTDIGAKPAGMGPPAGPAAVGDTGVGTAGATVAVGEDAVAVGVAGATVGDPEGLFCTLVAGLPTHPAARSATIAAVAGMARNR